MRRVLQIAQAIVDNAGRMSRPFQEWQALVTRLLPYTGTGSPELITLPATNPAAYYRIETQ